ncbi:MAG TPA: DNA primase [Anaerolineae bacterium]|nr:DNA primase [Anaerolineae bacterium]
MTAVDEIKARVDLVDVLSEQVSLKKSGRNYKGLCPFHAENTPSFYVFPETQTWHCFGACGMGGDVFSFVMKHENLDFPEALRLLAQRAGVELSPARPRDAEHQKQIDKLFEINAAATAYYHNLLLRAGAAEQARAYAAARGLSAETMRQFQLGFAPDAWRSVSDHLLERGYARQELLEVGLIIARDDGGYYDRFRDRLMIPIRDARGRVVGFGGRMLGEGQPKYLNSPQTPLFNKSHILYGLDLAKGAIRAQGEVVIVEGYMDVMQAHQAGFGNVVASMGTALTEHQLDLLKPLTKKYILALDPDLAGDQGTLRGLTVARQTLDRETVPVPTAKGWIRYETRLDADIRIVTLPEGRDPDDLIREAPEQWRALIDGSIPIVDYYFQAVTSDLDLGEAKGKSEAVRRLTPVISEIRDEVERTHYVQKLARMIRADETTVRRQLRTRTPAASRQGQPKEAESSRPAPAFALEEYCLAVLLRCPEYLSRVDEVLRDLQLAPLSEDDFARPENHALFRTWRGFQSGQEWLDWVERLPEELQQHVGFLLARGLDTDELAGRDAQRDIERRALQLRLKRVERTNQDLHILQTEALEQGDAKAPEYGCATVALTGDLLRLQRAISDRTALAQRERERAV